MDLIVHWLAGIGVALEMPDRTGASFSSPPWFRRHSSCTILSSGHNSLRSMDLRESMREAVSTYTTSSFAQVATSNSVAQAAIAMQKAGATEAIVLGEGKPIGILTERDILYKVVAAGSDPSSVKVKEVMTSPVETIEEDSKVAEAIAKMSRLGVRRLGVTRRGKLVGIITQKAVVSSDFKKNVPLPELASPHQFICPYCDAAMKTGEELSRHIDQVHLGLGLLEGDKTKW